MTAQVSDVVLYREKVYSLTGIKGDGLFEPYDHGLQLRPTVSACWRGYRCHYVVADEQLQLERLSVTSPEEEIAVFGVKPTPLGRDASMFHLEYRFAAQVIPFTGGLLLGVDFIDELYVHMGFHPAWKYEEVHELLFEKGRLTAASDRSKEMGKLRKELSRHPLEPGSDTLRPDLEEWIKQCFSLDYDF